MMVRLFFLPFLFSLLYQPLTAQDIHLSSRFTYYTGETEGVVLIWGNDAENILGVQLYRKKRRLTEQVIMQESDLIQLRFPLDKLKEGSNTLSCAIDLKNGSHLEKEVTFIKLPPHPNEVKVDRLTSGLLVNGLPFYPFGFYTGFPLGELPRQEAYNGFNFFGAYQSNADSLLAQRKAYMDLCASIGMKVHYHLNGLVGSGHNSFDHRIDPEEEKRREALLRREVAMFRDHPALLCWYLNDEPLGQSRPVAVVQEAYDIVKELDPYHPISIVFMMPHRAHEFGAAMDIAMTDPYPMPHGSVTMASSFVRQLREQFQYQKAIWLVPQAFGGGEFWTRESTAAELRAMTYLGLLEGAMGMQYFIRRGPNLMPKSPVAWHECSTMALETQAMIPWLFAGEEKQLLELPNPAIRGAYWKKGPSTLLVLVNTENEPQAVQVDVSGLESKSDAWCLFENRAVPVRAGLLEDFIDAYGSRAYVLGDRDPLEKVHPRNLILNPGFEDCPSPGTPVNGYASSGAGNPYNGATYFIDSRTAAQGFNALRMRSPKAGDGMRFQFYPIEIESGASYLFSIWAKAEGDGRFELGIKELDVRQSFTATSAWREYHFHFTVDQPLKNIHPTLSQTGAGALWTDLVQIVPDPLLEYQVVNDEVMLDIATLTPGASLLYSLGQEEALQEYRGPLTIRESKSLRVELRKGEQRIGRLEQYIPLSKATGKPVSFLSSYSPKYKAQGDGSLVDGITGTLSFLDKKWLGFEKKDVEFVLDLGELTTVKGAAASFLVSVNDGIHAPLKLEVLTSTDGEHYDAFGRKENPDGSKAQPPYKMRMEVESKPATARYVKFKVENIGQIPAGFLFMGTDAWLFLDEIEVY